MALNPVENLPVRRLAIVGAGLMGGSLALALRPSLDYLALIDTNPQTRTAVTSLADLVTGDFTGGTATAELVILAAPAQTIVRLLAELPAARPDGCLVLDLGSTKAAICRAMSDLPPRFQAIGGHPMCGKEIGGFAAADPDLFKNQPFVLCRNGRTTPQVEEAALAILRCIGSRPLFLSPELHDKLVGMSSHLPYLAAAALTNTTAALNTDQVWRVSASGFRDTTRLSGSDPTMMLDILLTNRTAVLNHLQNYLAELTAVQQLLQDGDEDGLAHWLAAAQKAHRVYKSFVDSAPESLD